MLGYLRTSEDIPRTCYDLRLRKGQKIVVLPMTSRILLREFIYEMGKRLEFSLFDSGNGMFTSSLTKGIDINSVKVGSGIVLDEQLGHSILRVEMEFEEQKNADGNQV